MEEKKARVVLSSHDAHVFKWSRLCLWWCVGGASERVCIRSRGADVEGWAVYGSRGRPGRPQAAADHGFGVTDA